MARVTAGGDPGEPQPLSQQDFDRIFEITQHMDEHLAEFSLGLGRLVQMCAAVEETTLSLLVYLISPTDFASVREALKRDSISNATRMLKTRLPKSWPESRPLLASFSQPFELRNRLSHGFVYPFGMVDGVFREGFFLGGIEIPLTDLHDARAQLQALHHALLQTTSLAIAARTQETTLDSFPPGLLTWHCMDGQQQIPPFSDDVKQSIARVLGYADLEAAQRARDRFAEQRFTRTRAT